jgi:hypothetical protein
MTQSGSGFTRRMSALFAGITMGGLLMACTPTVQMAAPKEPITVNLNVKIQHEILVKVDREIDNLLEENSDLF